MKQVFKFNRATNTPIVIATLRGRNGVEVDVPLIFDTGAVCTQLDTSLVDDLGYSAASDGVAVVSAMGPAGPLQEGYALHLEEIEVLGKTFKKPFVSAYDFDNLSKSRIVGLLGFDLIKEFHLEMHGPQGALIVFDE